MRERLKTQNNNFGRMGHIIDFENTHLAPLRIVGTTGPGQNKNDFAMKTLIDLGNNLNKLISTPSLQPIVINIDNEEQVIKWLKRSERDNLQGLGQ